jgi:mono/diheme cytochrome c family protein
MQLPMTPHGISNGQYYPALRALAAVGALVIGIQSPRSLNAQSNNYTAAQASAGRAVYSQSCASCHGPNIDDGEFAPPLKAAAFIPEVYWQAGQ